MKKGIYSPGSKWFTMKMLSTLNRSIEKQQSAGGKGKSSTARAQPYALRAGEQPTLVVTSIGTVQFYNSDQLANPQVFVDDFVDTGYQSLMSLALSANGTTLSPAVTDTLRCTAEARGYLSPYWLGAREAFLDFGTVPKPGELSVRTADGYYVLNAEQFENPERITAATCVPKLTPRTVLLQRFDEHHDKMLKEVIQKLREAIPDERHRYALTVWGTEWQWKRFFNRHLRRDSMKEPSTPGETSNESGVPAEGATPGVDSVGRESFETLGLPVTTTQGERLWPLHATQGGCKDAVDYGVYAVPLLANGYSFANHETDQFLLQVAHDKRYSSRFWLTAEMADRNETPLLPEEVGNGTLVSDPFYGNLVLYNASQTSKSGFYKLSTSISPRTLFRIAATASSATSQLQVPEDLSQSASLDCFSMSAVALTNEELVQLRRWETEFHYRSPLWIAVQVRQRKPDAEPRVEDRQQSQGMAMDHLYKAEVPHRLWLTICRNPFDFSSDDSLAGIPSTDGASFEVQVINACDLQDPQQLPQLSLLRTSFDPLKSAASRFPFKMINGQPLGTPLAQTLVDIQALHTRKGYRSPYWLRSSELTELKVQLKADAEGVSHSTHRAETSTFWYNVEETADPSRFTEVTCRPCLNHYGEPFAPLNSFVLRQTAIEKGYTSDYWITFAQAEMLDSPIVPGERPVVLAQTQFDSTVKYVSYFNADQTEFPYQYNAARCSPTRRFLSEIPAQFSVMGKRYTFRLAELMKAHAMQHGFSSPYWMTVEQAAEFGVEIIEGAPFVEAPPLQPQGEGAQEWSRSFFGYRKREDQDPVRLYNAEVTTDPSRFNEANCSCDAVPHTYFGKGFPRALSGILRRTQLERGYTCGVWVTAKQMQREHLRLLPEEEGNGVQLPMNYPKRKQHPRFLERRGKKRLTSDYQGSWGVESAEDGGTNAPSAGQGGDSTASTPSDQPEDQSVVWYNAHQTLQLRRLSKIPLGECSNRRLLQWKMDLTLDRQLRRHRLIHGYKAEIWLNRTEAEQFAEGLRPGGLTKFVVVNDPHRGGRPYRLFNIEETNQPQRALYVREQYLKDPAYIKSNTGEEWRSKLEALEKGKKHKGPGKAKRQSAVPSWDDL
jgi:hypothetical protein